MTKKEWQEIDAWHMSNGCSVKATAEHFNLSPECVKKHFVRARQRQNVPADGDKTPQNVPMNGDKTAQNVPMNGDKTAQNVPADGDKTAQNVPSVEMVLGESPMPAPSIPAAVINIKLPRSRAAALVAESIPAGLLYRHLEDYVTVEPLSDRPGARPLRVMDEARFTTWCEQYITWVQNAAEDAPVTSISEQQAKFILRSDAMRSATPEILEVSPVRLPMVTRHEGGRCTFAPAPLGLDAATGIYTQDTLPIEWDKVYPLHTCMRTLETVLRDFPLDGRDDSFVFCRSRSAAAAVTAMLGQFLHHSIRKFPMILSLANKSGTGKSFLIETILAPVHGPVDPTNYNTDESEMRKTLNSKLFDGAYYCYLDDIPSLVNNTINRYVTTNNAITDRILGTNTTFSLANRMQFFVTGNNLKTASDITRRSLPLDLHFAGLIKDRKFARPSVTAASFRSPSWRKDLLQCMWSLCKHWEAAGCPRLCQSVPDDFAEYGICAHIAMSAGMTDPWGPRQIALDVGDARGEALEDLLVAAADTIPGQWSQEHGTTRHTGCWQKFTTADMLKLAQDNDILEIIIPPAVDKARSLGQALRGLKGDVRKDSSGRQFEINDKKGKTRNYTLITILSEPTHAPVDDTGQPPMDETTPFD